jgi:hypothetical protein
MQSAKALRAKPPFEFSAGKANNAKDNGGPGRKRQQRQA